MPPISLTSEEVGRRIREARLAKGWTHEELARRMDVNWRTVQRWQKGSLPRVATLIRLADVLGVPQAYLVESDDEHGMIENLRKKVDELAEQVDGLTRLLAELEHERDGGRRRRRTPPG